MLSKAILFLTFLGVIYMPVLGASECQGNSEDQGGETNQRGPNGLKQGRWVYFGKDRPKSGFPLEGKVEEGPYLDDRKEGTWIKYHNDGVTPICIAVCKGRQAMVRALTLDYGADINKSNDFGNTPLYFAMAAYNKHDKMLRSVRIRDRGYGFEREFAAGLERFHDIINFLESSESV